MYYISRKEVDYMKNELEGTRLLNFDEANKKSPKEIINYVFHALKEKGYNPISQFVGYLMSGDPTYITSYNSARSLICRLERDEILEELVRSYLETHSPE